MQKSQLVVEGRVVRSEREFWSRRMAYAQESWYSVQYFADIREAAGGGGEAGGEESPEEADYQHKKVSLFQTHYPMSDSPRSLVPAVRFVLCLIFLSVA
jgi:hypothetical protein